MLWNQYTHRTEFWRIAVARRTTRNLFQTLDQIEVCEGAVETVDVGFSIGCDQDGPDGGYTGRISRHEFFPGCALSRGRIHSIDLGGDFAEPVDIER